MRSKPGQCATSGSVYPISNTLAEEAELAWALARVADPHLNAVERNRVYVAIGVGDIFGAIDFLIRAVVRQRLALPADLVVRFTAWLDVYAGHDDEPRLRALINQVKSPLS
jgi:hypothetical protein